jgi:hypothetical protein
MGPGTRTRYQHDARRQPDGTLTIFDNSGIVDVSDAVTWHRGRARRGGDDRHPVREYTHPDRCSPSPRPTCRFWRTATCCRVG